MEGAITGGRLRSLRARTFGGFGLAGLLRFVRSVLHLVVLAILLELCEAERMRRPRTVHKNGTHLPHSAVSEGTWAAASE